MEGFGSVDGGKGGIRTPGTVARTRDFQSRTFGHSVTFPGLNRVFSETLKTVEYINVLRFCKFL